MNNKTILITGGAGFIGSQLALHIQNNYNDTNIVIFDKFNNQEKFSNGNCKFLGSYKNLTGFKGIIIQGDIRNKTSIGELEKYKFDYIFHLAAISDTRAENESEVLDVNLNSFELIVNLAEKTKSKLVYASSGATYGSDEVEIQKIGSENPDNVYGFSKLMMDFQAKKYAVEKGVQIVGLRYFNVYGFGEENKLKTSSTILQFTKQFIDSEGPKLFEGSKTIYRDFIYIKDVIAFTIKAATSSISGVYNIGTGISRSFFDVASIIKNELKSEKNITYIKNPYLNGYQRFTKADISKSITELDYKPKYSLEDGIKDYIKKIVDGK